MVFLVKLVRLATRAHVEPLSVTVSTPFPYVDRYTEYFGIAPRKGQCNTIAFSAMDASRPFLTENERMWNFFEPELRRRLSEVDADASFATRVRSSLLELLPSGRKSIDDVARTLGVSRRTLQRRLSQESTSYQNELDRTREQLARHYLANSTLSGAEISFLLGFEEPSSFVRAFHSWTGTTPNQIRTSN
jgi:AraC-like DNA-binding protein